MTTEYEKKIAIAKRLASLPQAKQKALSERLAAEGIDIWQLPIVPVNHESAPLSFAQQRLWFIDQAEHGTSLYNLFFGLNFHGELNQEWLQASLNKVVERHHILRARIVDEDGIGCQQIRPFEPLVIDCVELSSTALAALASSHANTPFNLKDDRLFRFTLVKLAEDHHVGLLTIHHMVFDAWSIDNLVLELSQCYSALAANQPIDLPPLPIQYQDFAHWQRRWASSDAYHSCVRYWQQQLGGAPEQLNLTIEKTAAYSPDVDAAGVRDKGKEQSLILSPELSQGIYQLAQQKKTTLYITLLAAFNLLLERYSSESDICIGTSIANRPRLETEPLLGYFVNTLVMRNQLDPQQSFEALLQQVNQVATEAYEHQDLPFDHLLELLDVKRENARTPLFQIMFIMNNAAGNAQWQLPGVALSAYDKPLDKARFDLTLRITELKNNALKDSHRIRCDLEYSTQLFDQSDIETLLQHFALLLQQACAESATLLADFQLLPSNEAERYLDLLRGEALDTGNSPSIHQLFEQQVLRDGNALALICEGEQLNYNQLNVRANQLAHDLCAQDVGRESRVALLMDRSISLVVSMLAVLKAGGTYVPLDTQWPAQRLETLLADCKPQLVISESQWQTSLSSVKSDQLLFLDQLKKPLEGQPESQLKESNASQIGNPVRHVDATDAAYMIYTSGSTGEPKGVLIEHRHIIHYSQAITARLARDSATTKPYSFATISTAAADLGNTSVYGALCFGGCLHVIGAEQAFDPDAVAEHMATHQVDVLKIVPSHLRGLMAAEQPQRLLPTQWLILGGEVCPPALVAQIQQLAPELRILNHYGPTETTVGALTYEVPKHRLKHNSTYGNRSTLPIGRPLANYQAYVLDSAKRLCPPNLPGELYIGGQGVARSYFNRPTLTDKQFVQCTLGNRTERLYRTGDKARYLASGDIEFLGRIDQQIKIRGYRVELGDIEACIKGHNGISDAAVCLIEEKLAKEKITKEAPRVEGASNEATSQRLVAWIVEKEAGSSQGLHEQLEQQLPSYMLPHTYQTIESLPLNANGKLDRKLLQQKSKLELVFSTKNAQREPRSEMEHKLVDIWREVLCRDQISIDDSFFDFGGDSILSLRVIAKAKKAGIQFAPKQLFEHPTIAELAEQLTLLDCPLSAETHSPRGVINAKSDDALEAESLIEKAPNNTRIPLSFSQQRLWFLDQLQGPNCLYNIPSAIALDGPLKRDILERSFAMLVARHQSLSTRFLSAQGQPYQHIDAAADFAVQWYDLTDMDAAQALADARDQVSIFARHAFAIDQPGLFRVCVLQLNDHTHWLLVNCHHMIADGWSMGILVKEFCYTYHQLDDGSVPELPELPIQYRDYAYWQYHSGREYYEKQLEYWSRQLAAAPALLALPTDHPRPLKQSYRGANIPLVINAELTNRLKILAQQQGATLYTVLMAAWQILLYRYSGQDDICIGSPVANRHNSETQPLVGFFANTIVLRGDLSDNPSFTDFLQQIKRISIDAQANQDVPFEHLVEHLKVPRDTAYAPLFQVMFAWGVTYEQEHSVIATTNGPLRLRNVDNSHELLGTDTSKFDIELALRELGDGDNQHIEGRLEFATDLFEPATMERLWRHFTRLLQAVVQNPNDGVSEIPLQLTEEQQALEAWNDTEVSLNSLSFEQLFDHQIELSSDNIAVRFEEQSLTYQQLGNLANQLAHYLLAQGVEPDQRVLVCQRRSPLMLVSLLGVIKAGAAYVPVDPSYPADRVKYMLDDGGAVLTLTDTNVLATGLFEHVHDHNHPIINVEALPTLAEQYTLPPQHQASSANFAYLIYTSGSTGKPKAVQVSRGNMLNFLCAMQDLLQPNQNDRLLAVTSLSFDIAVLELYLPLLCGAEVVIANEALALDGAGLNNTLHDQAITLMQATPVSWKMMLAAGWHQQTPFKVLCGGEAFPKELANQLLEQPSLTVWNLYGPTETTVWSSAYQLDSKKKDRYQTVPIGRPIANTQIQILDAALKPLPLGVAGELCIGGAGVAKGYLGQAHLTQDRFVTTQYGRLYRTGDLARYRSDGTLECLGRLDQQVKVRGFRIELGEIESVLAQHKAVKEAIVYVQKHQGESILVGYVVLNTQHEVIGFDKALKAFLQQQLPDYMLPSGFLFMSALPLTPNGKVDRKALPTFDFATQQTDYIAPRNEIEEQLCKIWQTLLGVERVGIEDNFFELGGHSLLAARLKASIDEQFERDISLIQMFSHQTVAELAELIIVSEKQFKQNEMDWMEDLMDSMEEGAITS